MVLSHIPIFYAHSQLGRELRGIGTLTNTVLTAGVKADVSRVDPFVLSQKVIN